MQAKQPGGHDDVKSNADMTEPHLQEKDIEAGGSDKHEADGNVAQIPVERLDKVEEENYSVFTVAQKRAIILSGSFIGWLSPMSGSIYYPALNQIAGDLHVSNSKINITVTTYLILQSLAPMMIAGFSNRAGRRPAYFVCFIIYIIANLALALQNNYVALLVLRMLQSAGSSGTIALSQGLVGDCVVSAERGKYIAYASVAMLLGPSLSPILGGLIIQYADWHWIFWFLLILSIATFIPLALFLPETCRNIVGDASIPPPRLCANISDHIRFRTRARHGLHPDPEKQAQLHRNFRLAFPNPAGTLVVLADFESDLLLIALSLCMACYYAIFTDVSKTFHDRYAFSNLQVALVALPIGAGGLVSTLSTGRLVDWNYRRHARRLGFPVRRNRQADLGGFPIERARMQVGLPLMLLGGAAVVGYGWAVEAGVAVAGPLVLLFVLGYGLVGSFQVLDVLMVDIYPGQAADAAAARNFCQCLLGAASSAAIEPMIQAMGSGWAYTTLALIFVVSCTGPVAAMMKGTEWRQAKRKKAERNSKSRQGGSEIFHA